MEVEEGLPLEKAHAIAEEFEKKAKEECDELETLVIHMEPAKRKKLRVAVSIEAGKGLVYIPSLHFGGAPKFIIVDIDQGRTLNISMRS